MLAARLCVYRPAGCRGKDVDEPLDVGDQGVPGGAQGGADPPRSGADTGTSGRPTARRGHALARTACLHLRLGSVRPAMRAARSAAPGVCRNSEATSSLPPTNGRTAAAAANAQPDASSPARSSSFTT